MNDAILNPTALTPAQLHELREYLDRPSNHELLSDPSRCLDLALNDKSEWSGTVQQLRDVCAEPEQVEVKPALPTFEQDPGIAELMDSALRHPAKPVIEGLLNETETAGLHGPTEVFKTIFCLQLTEALATGKPLLGIWNIPQPRMVYFFETEMSTGAMGKRLLNMFDGRSLPQLVRFASETRLMQFKRAVSITAKFDLLKQWVSDAGAEVVIIDTSNPFFRGRESSNEETSVGEFFDRLGELSASTKLFVRHNRKHHEDEDADDTEKIRGSGQFSDVPDLLMQLTRKDKRTHEARFSITKYRHGDKPVPLTVWFDLKDFRLISTPPVIHVLKTGALSREELLKALHTRFDVCQSYGDAMILQVRDFLTEIHRGHQKVFEIDSEAVKGADWFPRLYTP